MNVVAIIACGLLASACSPSPGPGPGPGPGPTASSATSSLGGAPTVSYAIDDCLVGTWKELRYESFIDLGGVGGAAATVSGAGRTLAFEADGTETVDYGSGVTLRGVSEDGVVVESIMSGKVVFRVATANGVLSFVPVTDNVKAVYRSGGKTVMTAKFGSPTPVAYTCAGDRMTQSDGSAYSAEYSRLPAR